jgi:hypothetical protein
MEKYDMIEKTPIKARLFFAFKISFSMMKVCVKEGSYGCL